MRFAINMMIFVGSALMIYNIWRYGSFVKESLQLEHNSRNTRMLIVPLLLLIFFLVGYVIVGLTGMADLLIASILFFGSIFVFLMLTVMLSIISHIRSTDKILSTRYEEMKSELHTMTEDSMAHFLVNLTKDEIQDRSGDFLYESDYQLDSYTEMRKARSANVLESSYQGPEQSPLSREELLRRYREGQTKASEELLVRRKDGEPAFIHIEASLSTMPVSGDIIAFITERSNNEEIIRKALLEEVLMDQYDRIAYLIDGKYRVIISNVGKKTGLLFPDDEADTYESLYLNYILPTQPKDRKTEGPNPLRLSVIDAALSKDRVYIVDAPFILEGKLRYKRISFYRLDPKAKFYLMLISDSTAIQEEQRAQNQRLSELLEEARRSNEARTLFFTRVSHDLRTPMNGILGFTNLAKSEPDALKRTEYLDKAEMSGKKLVSIIEDLFAMSLIDSGKFQLEEKTTDLRALGEELRDRFAAERPEKEITFRLDTGELRDPVVSCDGRKLAKVLTRLLENSYEFVPQKESVSFAIRQLESENPHTGSYEFSICNCGIEIPEDSLNRIFDVQTWDGGERTGDLPGVGLGMSIAKEVIDRMGGTITARNCENSVTEFAIRLKLPIVPAADSKTGEEPETAAHAGRSLHVMLVDDNAINREIGELLLMAEGWTVELAEDGAQALDMVASSEPGRFDLVLMDVQMPVMNGYEATARIRELPDPEKAGIPIIAVTANAYQEDSNEAIAAGMDGYVSKPIDPDALHKVVSRVLTKGDRK